MPKDNETTARKAIRDLCSLDLVDAAVAEEITNMLVYCADYWMNDTPNLRQVLEARGVRFDPDSGRMLRGLVTKKS